MSKIHDVPDSVSNAGLEFDYSVWTAGSRVILSNVPWNSDYRDVVKFPSEAARNAFILKGAGVIDVTRVTYVRPGEPIRLTIPYSRAQEFNYIAVSNGASPGDPNARWYYYFINDVRHVNAGTTEFVVQLDIWQTYGSRATFGQCYIERGHIGIANTKAMDNNGRDYLTVPEGFDLGSEYMIGRSHSYEVANSTPGSVKNFDIIVASTVSWGGSGGTVQDPTLATAEGSTFEGLPNGCELYYFRSVLDFTNTMKRVSKTPWVASGIISITAIPQLENPVYETVNLPGGGAVSRLTGSGQPSRDRLIAQNFRTDAIGNFIPARYKNLKKFLTFPYMLVELTTHMGTPLILKPESMAGNDLTVVETMHVAPPSPRVAYYPKSYNAMKTNTGAPMLADGAYDGAEAFDMMTGFVDLPTFSVVNNGYLQYMASNRNSIAYQHASADWSQQKALQGNALAASQATAGMGAERATVGNNLAGQQASTSIQNDAAMMSALTSGAGQLAGGALSGGAGMAGAALGVASTAANAAIGTSARNAQLAASQANTRGNLAVSQGLSSYMRDSNKSFADFAATGDYENTIAAINAKVQDAKMIQPTTAGQIGGDAFMLAVHKWEIVAKIKFISSGAMRTIGEHWLRYGYAVNRFATPPADLQCMSKFTYWKMKETYIRGSMPEPFKQIIRGIFEKGVTVWADANDIGMVDMGTNDPKAGISL